MKRNHKNSKQDKKDKRRQIFSKDLGDIPTDDKIQEKHLYRGFKSDIRKIFNNLIKISNPNHR